MLTNGQNYLVIENKNIDYIFEGDWTISFVLLLSPVIDKDYGWAILFAKHAGDQGYCGPYILKHPDSYGLHAFLATDFKSHEFFDGPPVHNEIWTQVTFLLKQNTWSLYYDKSLVARLEL